MVVLICDYAVTAVASRVPGGNPIATASVVVITLIFIRMALRSNRWWTLVVAAASALCVLLDFLDWVHPGLSTYAAVSAQLGLWCVVHLALLAGVLERWLAGEAAVSDTAVWRRRRGAA